MAATSVALAREIDSFETSATAKSMCARSLQDAMRELRELAPAEEAMDGIDQLAEKRAARRSRSAET
jgi:hypothetical protein